jgi:hypothetical protein
MHHALLHGGLRQVARHFAASEQMTASRRGTVPAALASYAPGRRFCLFGSPLRMRLRVWRGDRVAGSCASLLLDAPGVRGWLAYRWAVPCGSAWMRDSLRHHAQGSAHDRTAVASLAGPVAVELGGR